MSLKKDSDDLPGLFIFIPLAKESMTESCSVYRDTQILLALRRRLAEEDLSEEGRQRLEAEISRLEKQLKIS